MEIRDKRTFINKLIEMGYFADMQDGIPYIYNVPFAKAEELVKELGYKGSFGVKKKEEQDG